MFQKSHRLRTSADYHPDDEKRFAFLCLVAVFVVCAALRRRGHCQSRAAGKANVGQIISLADGTLVLMRFGFQTFGEIPYVNLGTGQSGVVPNTDKTRRRIGLGTTRRPQQRLERRHHRSRVGKALFNDRRL